MFAMKKRRDILFILFFVMILSASVLAEQAIFYWYDEGRTLCAQSSSQSIGGDPLLAYAPFNNSACCDVESPENLVTLKFCTDTCEGTQCKSLGDTYVCEGGWGCCIRNAYDVNWDQDQVDCDCIGKPWLPGKVFESKQPSCCGDDTGEAGIVTQGIGGSACCDNLNDCTDKSGRCQNESGKEVTCEPWDGFDNDCDGKTDCSDTDCSFDPDCIGCVTEICNNNKDDDCDHYIDCADDDCIGNAICSPPCSVEVCSGGTDEDCDGKIDCKDDDCIGNPACPVTCVDEICNNGIDDDCDGLIDNLDWDCQGCPQGTMVCQNGKCCEDCENCGSVVKGCISQDGKCEEGEGCACEDCEGKRDSCDTYLACSDQRCLCPLGSHVCPDGKCRDVCGTCGNGIIESGEECDGSTLPTGIKKCDNLGLKGTIGCTNCLITGCTDGPANCGNEIIESEETCDGTNLAGKTCSSFGFDSGILNCFSPETEKKCHFDTFGCLNEACVNKNDKCEEGEGCACPDCIGEQSKDCGNNAVCDETGGCKCEDGTTLCSDGSCSETCATLPSCNGISGCEPGEGCACSGGAGCEGGICKDCVGGTDTCMISSTCINGKCVACSILKAYWTEDCIGKSKEVSMIVEGTPGCEGRTINIELYEQDSGIEIVLKPDDDVASMSAVFKNGKAELKWVTKWFETTDVSEKGDKPNDCAVWCDAERYYESPPKKFLEYYFIAKIGKERVQSDTLDVHYCIIECDADCDGYVDNNLYRNPDCQAALAEDPKYGKEDGDPEKTIRIDSNPKSGYCEDCTSGGLSQGQETCAAYYDCTPDWWKSLEQPEFGALMANWTQGGITEIDASTGLEWGECGDDSRTSGRYTISELMRQRLVCPLGYTKEECCNETVARGGTEAQANCYCKVPSLEIMRDYDCGLPDFRPTEIKACLAEEKFPFFTNMNILIVVLILTGFYIWKNREQEKTKTKR